MNGFLMQIAVFAACATIALIVVLRSIIGSYSEPGPETEADHPFEKKHRHGGGWLTVAASIIVLVVLGVGAYFIYPWVRSELPSPEQSTVSAVVTDETGNCDTMSRAMQKCNLSTTKRLWISTGSESGLMPCIYPLPYNGEYSLQYKHTPNSEPKSWKPGITESVSDYGLLGTPEIRQVKLVLAKSVKDCPSNPD